MRSSGLEFVFSKRAWKGFLFAAVVTSTLFLGVLYTRENQRVVVMKTPVNRIVKVVHSLAVNESRSIEKSKGNNLKEKSRGGNLMILSYMRSGSSMNGQVFSDNAENFYVYEPLIKLAPYHYLTEDHLCEMRTMKCRTDGEEEESTTQDQNKSLMTRIASSLHRPDKGKPPIRKVVKDVKQTIENATTTLKNIYSCNIRDLDDRILRSIMFEQTGKASKSGESWKNFTECYVNLVEPNVTNMRKYLEKARTINFDKHKNVMRILNQTGPRAEIFQKCLNKLEQNCRESKLRVTKVLRLSFRFLPLLMSEIPDLKILFVVRDPRGIMNSRIKTDWFPIMNNDTKGVTNNIESLCFKMNEDVKMIDKFKRDFPGRLKDLRLEDIVFNPKKTFRDIFDFIDLKMTDVYVQKIKNIFGERPTFLSTWNTTLNQTYIKLTEENCQYMLKTLKYELMYS